LLDHWLQELSRSTPVCGGILIGGRSQRMGRPKHLLRHGGGTWLEQIAQTVQPFVGRPFCGQPGESAVERRGICRKRGRSRLFSLSFSRTALVHEKALANRATPHYALCSSGT
jgi:hypothetical protein